MFWFASLRSASRYAFFKISLVVESGVFQNKHTNKITWGLYNKVSQDFFDALEIVLLWATVDTDNEFRKTKYNNSIFGKYVISWRLILLCLQEISKHSCFHQKYQNGFAQCEVPLEIIERRRGRRGQKKVDIYAFTKAKIMDVVIVVDLFVQHLFSCVSPVSCA